MKPFSAVQHLGEEFLFFKMYLFLIYPWNHPVLLKQKVFSFCWDESGGTSRRFIGSRYQLILLLAAAKSHVGLDLSRSGSALWAQLHL